MKKICLIVTLVLAILGLNGCQSQTVIIEPKDTNNQIVTQTATLNSSMITTTPSTGPQSLPIIDSTAATPNYISIPAETNQNYTFNIAANMKGASVSGYFFCTGGAPNLIEVYLMDDATYTKWKTNPGGQSTILYDSEEMSSGQINQTNMLRGTYHLIFSNKASADLSAVQEVVTSISLNWTY